MLSERQKTLSFVAKGLPAKDEGPNSRQPQSIVHHRRTESSVFWQGRPSQTSRINHLPVRASAPRDSKPITRKTMPRPLLWLKHVPDGQTPCLSVAKMLPVQRENASTNRGPKKPSTLEPTTSPILAATKRLSKPTNSTRPSWSNREAFTRKPSFGSDGTKQRPFPSPTNESGSPEPSPKYRETVE